MYKLKIDHKATMNDEVVVKNYRRKDKPEKGRITAVRVQMLFGSAVPSISYDVQLERLSVNGKPINLNVGEEALVTVFYKLPFTDKPQKANHTK